MIARVWKGWTKVENADRYENLIRNNIFFELKKINGCKGGYILRDDREKESEFVIITFFDSLNTIKKFAGENYQTPVFEPEAKKLLSRMDKVAFHYEVKEYPQLS